MAIEKRVALSRRSPRRGDEVTYPWYPNFVVKKWITSFENSMGIFHAVILDDGDLLVDTRRRVPPVWVFDCDGEFSIWHDIHQRPLSVSQLEFNVERVICHYESEEGDVYYAVEMSRYLSPIWLLDSKESIEAIQTYCLRLSTAENV